MSARKVHIVPAPVLAKVEGFEVASPAPSPNTTSQGQKPKQSVSLLSMEISSTLSEGLAYTDEDRTETDCYSDDDDEDCVNSIFAIPIAIKDEIAYKAMLRARAVVNCRLWQQSSSEQHDCR